ncbi:formyltransferase family protein [Acanthopleuribacter pedis]|uniref:Formyl transferase N-terminal domain-containing protein n=1 Tax=Acanthopleuribacter pedis TaxID=442870 RepID=A0A8J7QGQ5_9BACT|nr:formyltransferase family protein [Acanthopleuribacter pedis]MBO1318353.1 hypothetical protein [Acanthopleuribacter pedis]
MKILTATGERLAGGVVSALLRAGCEVPAVISPYQGVYRTQCQGLPFWRYDLAGWDIGNVCRRKDIPIRVARRLDQGDIHAFVRHCGADLLLVFGWPHLIPSKTVQLFPHGGINVHPSRLPLLRGADPIFSVVDEQAPGFGISIHRLEDELDGGAIYHQQNLARIEGGTYDDHYARFIAVVPEAVTKVVEMIRAGIEPTPQSGAVTEAIKFRPRMRLLKLDEPPAALIRRTQACHAHHPRVAGCDSFLFSFKQCWPLPAMPEKQPNGTVIGAGLWQVSVFIGGAPMLLSGVRVLDQPIWQTPRLLKQVLQPGKRLLPYETLRNRVKAAAKK